MSRDVPVVTDSRFKGLGHIGIKLSDMLIKKSRPILIPNQQNS